MSHAAFLIRGFTPGFKSQMNEAGHLLTPPRDDREVGEEAISSLRMKYAFYQERD
jgi:hypothetical protein